MGSEESSSPAPVEMRCPMALEDVDLFGPGAPEQWYAAYDILHAEAPVHRLPGEGLTPESDAFVLTRHEDIARVVKDEVRYPPIASSLLQQVMRSDRDPFERSDINVMFASMTTLRPNPALWRSHRKELTDPWVGPGAGRNREMIERVAAERAEAWLERGSVEFIGEYAQPVPHTVMANILGWPLADLKLLKTFGDGTVVPFVYGAGHRCVLDAEGIAAQQVVLQAFRDYTADLIRAKRAAPADDMISFLTTVTYSPLERRLTDDEINGIVYAMVIGGLETTQYALAEQMQLLIEHPDVWRTLKRDRSKVRAFCEEGMRLRAPTQGLSTRLTSRDEVFQGVEVPAGSILHMRWAAANIDPKEWEDAQSLNLERKAATRHLTFSAGPRVCPGAHLSRLEQNVVWQTLLDRVDEFHYATDNDFLHQPGIMLSTRRLNLEFSR
ncbi:MAG: cytochrome P450 [Pseudomonadota bacterium]